MKSLKMKELEGKSIAEIEEMVQAEKAAIFKTRRDLVFRQISDTSSLSVRRHNIARMLTKINQLKKSEAK